MKFYLLALETIKKALGDYPEHDELMAYDLLENLVYEWYGQYENLKPFGKEDEQ
jgi:hypothetical protein